MMSDCCNAENLWDMGICANFAHTTSHGAIKGKTQTKNKNNENN